MSSSSAVRRSMIVEASGDGDTSEARQKMRDNDEPYDEHDDDMIMTVPRDFSGVEMRQLERPKTAVAGNRTMVADDAGVGVRRAAKKYRHMFYSGTWPRVHSELFTGEIDRLAPRDRNMVMFQDVRKKFPETFIFHPEWV